MVTDALVSIQEVSRVYQGVIRALDSVSLSVDAGETVALLGPSGSGKSTLLMLLAGYESPTTGSIRIDGRPLGDWPRTELLTRQIGFIFQEFYLLEHLTALQNVELALFTTDKNRHRRRALAMDLLDGAGLASRALSRARNLSGGERQRVAFCRSVVNRPRLLLADEPTGNLDSRSKHALMELMSEHVRTHSGTLLVATHDSGLAAICERVISLKDGRVEWQ